MVCNFLNHENVSARILPELSSRITYSDLRQYELYNYQAPTYSIKYVLQGSEHYVLNNRRIILRPGNFLLVNSHQSLDCFVQGKQPARGFCIHLDPRLLGEVYTHHSLNPDKRLDMPAGNESVPELEPLVYNDKEGVLGALLQKMAGSFDAEKCTLPFEENALYPLLCDRLLQQAYKTPKSHEPLDILRYSTRQELLRRLSIARDLLHSGEEPTSDMTAIAKMAMLSVSHFYRSFRKVYGVSPYQYGQQRRLEKAAELLRGKSMPVQDIAFRCGFPDLPSFSRAFKKAYGLSPVQFRKRHSLGLWAR